ncbi:MAG: hypothetical protein ACK4WK_06005 [Anaerolineae bacterium]
MEARSPARFPFYGWLGALIVIGAEIGLILRQPFISRFLRRMLGGNKFW